MVYLDPKLDRPVSQYSPEGEIRMMGELASGLRRRGAVSRPMAILLVVLILAPILVSVLALLTSH
jgi:membrane-associated PAP2 superfamily phosphatase